MEKALHWLVLVCILSLGTSCLGASAAHGQDLQGILGTWSDSSDPRTCDISLGSSPDVATIFQISPKVIEYYEIDCAVRDASSTVDGVQMDLDCFKGGGVARWFETAKLKPFTPNKLQFSSSNRKPPLSNASGPPIILYRCPSVGSNAETKKEQLISQWTHNGSIMSISEANGSIEIDYLEPRTGMRAVGVRPQTMLFSGSKDANRVEGNAYIFDSKCGPVSYAVEGQFSTDGRSLLLSGQSPRVNGACDVVRSVAEVLRFERKP
jgi:hypothetical protein